MSAPKKHHYLPIFFMRRWANAAGIISEYRRPRSNLVIKQRYPAATGYLGELYSDESKTDPVERQALEMVFMQKVDDNAANALAWLEQKGTKPSDSNLRDAWTRFLMSLLHRSPERVKYLTAKVKAYEEETLNPELRKKYPLAHGPNDPSDFDEWLTQKGPITPDLRVRLLRMLIDNKRIGDTINEMRWTVHSVNDARFSLFTGDHPIMISNGLGHRRSFVMLAISPSRVFIAGHKPEIITAFTTQTPNAFVRALNDACTRQSRHVIVAQDAAQSDFIERRFLRLPAPVGPTGFVTWEPPLVETESP